jgi:hypothetical protein
VCRADFVRNLFWFKEGGKGCTPTAEVPYCRLCDVGVAGMRGRRRVRRVRGEHFMVANVKTDNQFI